MDNWAAVAASLGIGGILGWSAAYAIKTVGKLLGCLLGIVFILLQVLAYYGIAEIHWDKVAAMAPAGHVASQFFHALWKILTYNLPFTGGFTAGFWMGWRRS